VKGSAKARRNGWTLGAIDLPAILMGTAAVMTAAAKLIEAWRGRKRPPHDHPEVRQPADTKN
jgi:hypothetical protein